MANSVALHDAVRSGKRVYRSNVKSNVIEMQLRPREARTLHVHEAGVQILCTDGVLWITQGADANDYILVAGERFIVSRPGYIVVQGLAPMLRFAA